MHKSFWLRYFLLFLLITPFMSLAFPHQAGAIETVGDPCIALSKTGPTTAIPGETITYEFIVENCGSMDFASGVAWVVDPMFGTQPIWTGNLYAGSSHTLTKDYLVLESDCGVLLNTATAYGSWDNDQGTVDATDADAWTVSVFCLYQGCTPGYWKQQQHFDSWMVFGPEDMFSAVFGNDAFPGMTLLQVLKQGGGGIKALGRHAVAALLNAASPGVSSDRTTEQVIDMFNTAYTSGDEENIENFKNFLNDSNEQGCPLD
jgi:hypothetical protein